MSKSILELECEKIQENFSFENNFLNLSNRNISKDQFKDLMSALKENTTIQTLSLSDTRDIAPTRLDDDYAEYLAEVLEHNTVLSALDLSGNQELGNRGMIAIMRALEKNTHLKSITLSKHNIDEEAMQALAKVITQNTTLTQLFLENCAIDADKAIILSECFKHDTTLPGLQTLSLTGNKLEAKGIKLILDSLREKQNLEYLYINNCDIANAGAQPLAEFMLKKTSLKFINLANNQIPGPGLKAVSESLMASNISDIVFDHNETDRESMLAIANLVAMNKNLRSLSLASAGLDSETIKPLAEILLNDNHLQILNLTHNNIALGVVYISDMLKKNQTLKHLFLDLNNIGEQEGLALVSALHDNVTLESLALWGNHLGDQSANAWLNLYHNKKMICAFNLEENPISEKLMHALMQLEQWTWGFDIS